MKKCKGCARTSVKDVPGPYRPPPNKALQLTGHSAVQSIHGTIWRQAPWLQAATVG